jgi:hypothetical protein
MHAVLTIVTESFQICEMSSLVSSVMLNQEPDLDEGSDVDGVAP